MDFAEQDAPQVVAPNPRAATTLQSAKSLTDGVSNGGAAADPVPRIHTLQAPNSASPAWKSGTISGRQADSSRPMSAPASTRIPTSWKREAVPSWAVPLYQEDKYRRRSQEIASKLFNFFGDLPPVDISVTDIEKDGLKALLQSTLPMCYFLYSLLTDYCCENLFFFLEIEHYRICTFASENHRYEAAAHIYRIFLAQNSHLEVNVDDRVRRNVENELKTPSSLLRIFDTPTNAVIALMEGSFLKFMKGPIWGRMVQDLGRGNIHSLRTRHKAVAILRDYLQDQRSLLSKRFNLYGSLPDKSFGMRSDAGSNLVGPDIIKRSEFIWAMVEDFCLKFAMVDVTDDSNFEGLGDDDEFRLRKNIGVRFMLSTSFGRRIASQPKDIPSEGECSCPRAPMSGRHQHPASLASRKAAVYK